HASATLIVHPPEELGVFSRRHDHETCDHFASGKCRPVLGGTAIAPAPPAGSEVLPKGVAEPCGGKVARAESLLGQLTGLRTVHGRFDASRPVGSPARALAPLVPANVPPHVCPSRCR